MPEFTPAQIDEQLSLAVDRVMSEGSLYDRRMAALAIKQARGDLIEAIFLLRAYRTTLPRFGFAEPLDTTAMPCVAASPRPSRTCPAAGARPDLRLHPSPARLRSRAPGAPAPADAPAGRQAPPRVTDILARDDLIDREAAPRTLRSATSPATRWFSPRPATPLQNLARGDEGFLLGLAYSTQRGYGRTHPFVGEIRFGEVEVELFVEELGFAVQLGAIAVTECQMVNQFTAATASRRNSPAATASSSARANARRCRWRWSIARSAPRTRRGAHGPAQDEEFVLSHSDNVQATGFVEHLKLPHYVDFQAELALLSLRREARALERTRQNELPDQAARASLIPLREKVAREARRMRGRFRIAPRRDPPASGGAAPCGNARPTGNPLQRRR